MEYVVQRRLGRGGMGVVDLAIDPDGRTVACKRLLLHGSADEMHRARQRIRREAAALERLEHPAIVPLLDVVDDGDDVVLVLPYLQGGTLGEQVHHHGPLSPGQVHRLADVLFDALAAAHRQGVVHRDIKPANVLFDLEGEPYLVDFGVASLRDVTGGLTATGSVVGTPEFMAPEQARGEPATSASDVFSLGATLLYGATGHPPYGRAEAPVTLQRAARGRLSPLPADLDRSVRRRLQPTLARNPQRRPTAAAAAAGKKRARGDEAPVGPEGTRIATGALPRPRRPRRRLALAAAATVAILGVVVAVAALTRGDGQRSEASADPTTTAPPTTECVDLPYQPCGSPPAPGTDGTACLEGRADYDGDPTTGCEAVSDRLNGTELTDVIQANLVPGDAVDKYPMRVAHHFDLLCDNEFRVTLVAPSGASMRLDVLDDDGKILGSAVSDDGSDATVRLGVDGSDCYLGSDVDLVARVSWEGTARTAELYELSRAGSF